MATATEQTTAETTTETVAETTPAPEAQATPAPETKAFDPNALPAEAKEYFEKQYSEKYKDYDTLKREAEWARTVQNDSKFREWQASLNAPKKPEFTISPEDHSAALADPAKFQELVLKAADFVAKSQLAPQIEQMSREAQFQKATSELNKTIEKHPEFVELDKAGHIMPVLQKYPGISFDDALAIAKANTGWTKKEIAKEAAGEVQKQKAAITERPGSGASVRANKKFKNREAAMMYVMEQVRLGKDVDEDSLDIG